MDLLFLVFIEQQKKKRGGSILEGGVFFRAVSQW